MSDIASQPSDGSAPDQAAPAPGAGDAGAAAPVVPSGYVPVSELEKARQTAQGLQSERDRLRAQLERASAPPAAPDSTPASTSSVIEEAVARVFKAGELMNTAAALKAEFPDVAKFDPSIFTSGRLSTYDSPDALRTFVEDVNQRLTIFRSGEVEAQDEATRNALAAAASGANGPTGGTPPPAGDPTIEQLNALSPSELNARLDADPTLMDRVLARLRAAA